ncbi:hypothetical protein MMON_55080 [Mycolicibacterium monacense]|uniref:Post-SET domain-containing protein n=2 Tax=Mycobacteriaceae TaxID=1762 RepID=A0AAD1N2F8_MYCMB|nr:hypothetical protein MMON_55080 [Mycolicibacterium monacense]
MIEDHPWRFTNHSCEPNAVVRGRHLVSLTAIEVGDEVTFNYNTTEYVLAEPFVCNCGSPRCVGAVRGFVHLRDAERRQLLPLLASHLVAVFDTEASSYRPSARQSP